MTKYSTSFLDFLETGLFENVRKVVYSFSFFFVGKLFILFPENSHSAAFYLEQGSPKAHIDTRLTPLA